MESDSDKVSLNKVKKLAIVTTIPPLNTSLSEYGKFLVEGLLKVTEELEIHVLADLPPQDTPLKEMSHERLTVTRCWNMNSSKNPAIILKHLKDIDPEVVIFNVQFATFGNQKVPAMLGLTIPMLAKAQGYKVMTVLHNMIEAIDLTKDCFAKNKLDKWLIQTGGTVATKLLLQSTKLVITLDKYKEILKEKYQANNAEVIGLGSYYDPVEEVVVQKENRFLTFGKFGAYKKLEFLLDATENLVKDYPDMELVIGGTDHPNYPGYMDSIEEKYAHLKDNVKFIGWIEDDDLPARINESKAVVLSYESTAGSSGPLHIAMSQGKPVVAPDIGDFVHVANNEDVELIFYKNRNMEDFETQMKGLLDNTIDLESIGQHNLNIAQRHSSTRTAIKYRDLINSLINEGRTTSLAPALNGVAASVFMYSVFNVYF